VVLSNKQQSVTFTEDTSIFLDESDVISEESDDFFFYDGVQTVPCVQVLSHRWEFNN